MEKSWNNSVFVDTHADTKSETLWYFAYGSNMSSAKFTGSRGIVPIDSVNVRIPNYILVMEIPGLPYSEPSFSSITPRHELDAECGDVPDVVGVAYLITVAQYRIVIASEGGGVAYRNVRIKGVPVSEKDEKKVGGSVEVRTLVSGMQRSPNPRPSARYMKLINVGAREMDLPANYQVYLNAIATYQPPSSSRTKLGAAIYIAIFGPVMAWLERITKANIQDDGTSPQSVILLVRCTMLIIWALHDFCFAPIFGRGDGLEHEKLDYNGT